MKRAAAGRAKSSRSSDRRQKQINLRVTERANLASADLDTKPTREILRIINREDANVAPAVAKVISEIARTVDLIVKGLSRGGRLVYLGAGTSGRLGVLDAAECIPTFGTDRVIGVMAGAPKAMLRPSEVSEDDPKLGERDLRRVKFTRKDVLVGISASGRTPYVIGGMKFARSLGATVVALTCNPDAPMNRFARVAIAPVVGPEVIAGSTRMKAGTAQKLVLNMLSTASMVRLGRVFSNMMVNVQLKNEKLRQRALGILAKTAGVSATAAARALEDSGRNLPAALLMLWKKIPKEEALSLLSGGWNTAAVLRETAEKIRTGLSSDIQNRRFA